MTYAFRMSNSKYAFKWYDETLREAKRRIGETSKSTADQEPSTADIKKIETDETKVGTKRHGDHQKEWNENRWIKIKEKWGEQECRERIEKLKGSTNGYRPTWRWQSRDHMQCRKGGQEMAARDMSTMNEKIGTWSQLRVTMVNIQGTWGEKKVIKRLTAVTDILDIC